MSQIALLYLKITDIGIEIFSYLSQKTEFHLSFDQIDETIQKIKTLLWILLPKMDKIKISNNVGEIGRFILYRDDYNFQWVYYQMNDLPLLLTRAPIDYTLHFDFIDEFVDRIRDDVDRVIKKKKIELSH